MPDPTNRTLAVVAALCWVAIVVGAVVAAGSGAALAAPILAVPGYGTVGGLLGIRRPTNPIGWLLMATASVPLLVVVIGLSPEMQNGVAVAALALVLVLFPTGSPPSRRWLVPMILVVVSWLGLGRLGVLSFGGGFELEVSVVLAAISLTACATAPMARFRRADGLERAQLRWLGAAAGLTILGVVLIAAGLVMAFEPLFALGGVAVSAGFAFGIPGAILVAILRYRLYDIGRIVSRTVTYAVVAVLVSAVYAIPVLVAPQVLGSSSDLVTAAATLGAAAAFSPLRRRVRAVVDRRFNRSAYDAARLMEHFADGLRDEVDLAAINARFAGSVARALQPRSVSVWIDHQG